MRRHFIINSLLLTASALAVELLLASPAMAGTPTLPTGGTFVAGTGSISTSGSTETVQVSSAGGASGPGVIDWHGFSVGAGGTISYVPASGGPTYGVIVNVDKSGSVSTIDGTISSPDYAQVIVNPAGISVGSTASLPAQTELAAGTLNPATGSSPVTITADGAPITVDSTIAGESSNTNIADYAPPGIPVVAASGDTLPDSIGLLTNVIVPAGQSSSFTLQPGQTGTLSFIGPTTATGAPSSPSNVSVTGPAGGTVGELTLQEGRPGSTLPTGTLSVSNVTSGASLYFESGQGITLSGRIVAPGGVTAVADPYSPPPSGSPQALTLASGSTIGATSSSGSIDLESTTTYVGNGVDVSAPVVTLDATNAITSIGSAAGSITDTVGRSNFDITTPSISRLSIAASGSIGNEFINTNSISNGALNAFSVTVAPGPAPDYKPISLNNVSIATPGLAIGGAYGVSMDGVTQTLPSGWPSGFVSISGATTEITPGTSGYPASTNAVNTTSISNSSFDVGQGGSIDISAGVAAGSGFTTVGATSNGTPAIPGAVTITGSTLKSAGGSVSVSAYDAGSIDIGSGSTLTADEAGACDGSSAACTTAILAQTVDFGSGNAETASAADQLAAGSTTGTANATPAETTVSGSSSSANVMLDAAGGTATVDGTLDAGTPSPGSTSPSTGTGGTTPPATGGTPGGSTTPSTGTGSSVPPSTPAPPPVVVTVPPVVTAPRPVKPARPVRSRPAPRKPSVPIVTIAPVTIEPSATVSTVEQHGSTVLVPEGSNGPDRPRVDLGDGGAVTARPGAHAKAATPAASPAASRPVRQAVPQPVAPRPAPRPVATHKRSAVRQAAMATSAMPAPGFSIGAPAPAAPPAMTALGFSLTAETVADTR